MKIVRYPSMGECIAIKTFFVASHAVFFMGIIIMLRDELVNTVANVRALLMLLNKTTCILVSPKAACIEGSCSNKIEAPIKISVSNRKLDGANTKFAYIPQYSDIDINNYVNHIRYADWLCNSI